MIAAQQISEEATAGDFLVVMFITGAFFGAAMIMFAIAVNRIARGEFVGWRGKQSGKGLVK